jgi:hypothetical protein
VVKIADDAESFPAADEAERLKRDLRYTIFKTKKGRYYRIVFDFTDVEVRILRVRWPGQRSIRKRDLPPI